MKSMTRFMTGLLVFGAVVQISFGYDATVLEEAQNAASRGDIETLTRLLNGHSGLLQARGADGRTLLHWAAFKGGIKAIDFLLSKGLDVDCVDTAGTTPLHVAVAS